jgi:hypothetical protein
MRSVEGDSRATADTLAVGQLFIGAESCAIHVIGEETSQRHDIIPAQHGAGRSRARRVFPAPCCKAPMHGRQHPYSARLSSTCATTIASVGSSLLMRRPEARCRPKAGRHVLTIQKYPILVGTRPGSSTDPDGSSRR